MNPFRFFETLWVRMRYPASLPEEVADALGITLSNTLTFHEFIDLLPNPICFPTKLKRYMPREMAEDAFKRAFRKERFSRHSQYFYYFNEGWVEFILHFDDLGRLRRIYLQHKAILQDQGIEIPLSST